MTGFTSITENGDGVRGETSSEYRVAGVAGIATNHFGRAAGVIGESASGPGIFGRGIRDAGVVGYHGDPELSETTVANDASKAGIFGASDSGAGILGYTTDPDSPAVYSFGLLRALALGGPFSAEFDGDIKVVGDIQLSGADCAERFDVGEGEDITPGTVVVVDHDDAIRECRDPYDTRVAGVVAGAGPLRPGIVLNSPSASANGTSVSLVGRTYCKVDGQYGGISIGDLLTSSGTPGHAMRAADQKRSFGATIGKALGHWRGDCGLIPILVALG